MMSSAVEQLPDFPAIQQINQALWRRGRVRGAAVLVGAGFSRNAKRIHADSPMPPLWGDITSAIATRLGYAEHYGKDPLRLAEEFVVLLGRPALEELLRELVLDEQWSPSELQEQLVALPWKEVLTTNWDTLLERAAERNISSGYDVVRCIEDLSTTGSPRIVKLHGSFPASRPFILSEEDYRTYPKKFAPFVNLVQQTLLENELCLLGFSGDDPNFLEWTGWIRDHLGDSARRIYLVGVLKMNPAQRRLLETRNITPVDLAPLVEQEPTSSAHAAAMGMFLEFLKLHKPAASWDWTGKDGGRIPRTWPRPADEHFAELMLQTAKEWARLRQAYPGWLVCPRASRDELKRDVYEWLDHRKALDALSPQQRTTFVYEAVWRINTAVMPLAQHRDLITELVRDQSGWVDQEQRAYVLTVLLAEFRQDRERELFDEFNALLNTIPTVREDFLAKARYEVALWDRDSLDFVSLDQNQEQITGQDPVWSLRRAGLLANLGRWDEARAIIREAWIEIRNRHLRDRNSIWSLSRLAWCHMTVRQSTDWYPGSPFNDKERETEAEQLQARVREEKCDPWDWLTAIDREVHENLRTQQERKAQREPTFDVGRYRQHNTVLFSSSWLAQPIYDYERIAELTGLPWRFSNVQTLVKRLEEAESLAAAEGMPDVLFLLRLFQDDGQKSLEKRFGRIEVALLSIGVIDLAQERLHQAITYAIDRLPERKGWGDQFWSSRLASYLEVLSRLIIRSTQQDVVKYIRMAFQLALNTHCHVLELAEVLDHFIQRAFSALSKAQKPQFLPDLLSFPLAQESSLIPDMRGRWPSIWNLVDEAATGDIDVVYTSQHRIDRLIAAVGSDADESRSEAALRLLVLHDHGFLTQEQQMSLSKALWIRRDGVSGYPAETRLLPHVYFRLPAPEDTNLKALYKQYSFGSLSSDVLTSLSALDGPKLCMKATDIFTNEELLLLMDKLLAWRPEAKISDFTGQITAQNRIGKRYVGSVLAKVVFRSFSVGQIKKEVADQVLAAQIEEPAFIQAFADLARIFPETGDTLTHRISEVLLVANSDQVWAALLAIRNWVKLQQAQLIAEMPAALIESLLRYIETRREVHLADALAIASLMLSMSAFTGDQQKRLARALQTLAIETSYASVQTASPLSADVTRIRMYCVQVAAALEQQGQTSDGTRVWLDSYQADPIPEVRFALEQD